MINAFNIDNMQFMASKPDKYYNLAIVDPPYFNGPQRLGYYGERTSSIGVKREEYKKIGTWGIPDQTYLDELIRVSNHQIIWGINYFKFHHCVGRIVWDKCNGDSSFSDCEIASCSIHDSVRMFRYMWNGMMQGKSISEGHIVQGNKKLNEKRIHPTQKPVAVYKWLLKQYAASGDKILDTHGGSFSHAIAAYDMGFDLDICEIDEQYFQDGLNRLEQHKKMSELKSSQMSVFL